MIDIFQLIALFAFLGGAIKFIDQAYDERAFSTSVALVVAIMAGVVMGYLMARDSPFSTSFFAAMFISLVLAKKIDNFAFAIGAGSAVATLITFYSSSSVSWLVLPIIVFLAAGFVDEIADDMAHKHNIEGFLRTFLNYRPFSDFALVGMVMFGTFSWVYLLPYFSFTFFYMLVERYSEHEYSFSDGVDWLRSQVSLWGLRPSQ